MQYLESLAADQRGLVTRRQLLAVHSVDAVRHLLDSQRLFIVRRGVYRLPGVQVDRETDLLAAVLAATRAVASHRSAAMLWDLRLPHRSPEILVEAGRSVSLAGVKVRQSDALHVGCTTMRAIPCTSVERTLIDCSAIYPSTLLERAAEDAIVRKLTSFDRLRVCLEGLATPGRRRISIWNEMLRRRMDLAHRSDSVLSARVRRIITDVGIAPPVSEFRVPVSGDEVYAIDLAFPSRKIAIECDGRAAHEVARFESDRLRDNQLTLRGWLTLRFTWNTSETAIVDAYVRHFRSEPRPDATFFGYAVFQARKPKEGRE